MICIICSMVSFVFCCISFCVCHFPSASISSVFESGVVVDVSSVGSIRFAICLLLWFLGLFFRSFF
jgi:hypothetical protein